VFGVHNTCVGAAKSRAQTTVVIFWLENHQYFNAITNEYNYETVITINETLTVCSQFYYCKAVIVHIGPSNNAHTFTFVKLGNKWVRLDDQTTRYVIGSMFRMLPIHCYTGPNNRYTELVFYEKLSPTQRPLTKSEQQLVHNIQPINYNQ